MTGRTDTPTAVICIVHQRHDHLRGVLWGLANQHQSPHDLVIVAMDDDQVASIVENTPVGDSRRTVHVLSGHGDDLPLSHARNAGAAAAVRAGAEQLIFLDVDCIPEPSLVRNYSQALREQRSGAAELPGPHVVSGGVIHLPSVDDPADYRSPAVFQRGRRHPSRPFLEPGELRHEPDLRLFWSLSFGITAADWRTAGGFDEAYIGYGAEDTDFAQRLRQAEGRMSWVGGADVYHQYHAAPSPPLQHLESIVRNANTFHDRWGWFPMETWLEAFARLGLAELDRDTSRWVATRGGCCDAGPVPIP